MAKQMKSAPPSKVNIKAQGMKRVPAKPKPQSSIWKQMLLVGVALGVGLIYVVATQPKAPTRITATETVAIIALAATDVIQPTNTATQIPITNTMVVTLTPSVTATASPTITDTPESVMAATVAPTTPPISAVQNTASKTYYASRDGTNVRSCPKTSCDVVAKIDEGESILSDGYVNGDTVNIGNSIWYRVSVNGKEAYVYSSVVLLTKPLAVAQLPSGCCAVTTGNTSNVSVPQSVPPAKTWDCSGNYYDCSDFASRAEMNSYWAACPGDPSHLDGNNDGQYCEGPH